MKTAVCILIALLVGLVLGSLPIKADLRNARTEINDLKKKLATRDSGQSGLSGITSMLRIPEKAAPAPRGRHRPAAPFTASAPAASGAVATATSAASTNAAAPERAFHPHPDSTNLLQTLETASALWKARSDLARNSFVSNVATSSDQAAQFEVAMAAMNLRLSNSIRTWVDYVKQQKDVTPETGIRMMNDLSSTLVLTYNDLDRALPADWRQKAGPKFQVFDFINPDVALPLTEVEAAFRAKDRGPNAAAGDAEYNPDSHADFSVEFP